MRSLIAGSLLAGAAAVTEYVAMVPIEGGIDPAYSPWMAMRWTRLEYAVDATSLDDITVTTHDLLLNDTDAATHLGAWLKMDVPDAELTAKVHGERLWVPMKTDTRTEDDHWTPGGCCANILRAIDKTGAYVDLDLEAILDGVFGTDVTHGQTHTFDVETTADGREVVYLNAQYVNTDINANINTIVAIDAADGTVIPTADGRPKFDLYKELGVLGGGANETIFGVYYYDNSAAAPVQMEPDEWHLNGIERFVAADGNAYVAITHYHAHECLIVLDPWDFSRADGGGKIVQRFGTPALGTFPKLSGYHHFGVDTATTYPQAVHNVFYSAASNTEGLAGVETLTVFVNVVEDADVSFVAEFAFAPTAEPPGGPAALGDAVFETEFVTAAADFSQWTCGGARPIGDGLYVISSGAYSDAIGFAGLELVDRRTSVARRLDYGNATEHPSIFDPFIRVVVVDE